MEVVVQSITKRSKFGVSPFATGMTHRDVPLEAQLATQMAMGQLTDEDVNRYTTIIKK
jgi:hypothetical protein